MGKMWLSLCVFNFGVIAKQHRITEMQADPGSLKIVLNLLLFYLIFLLIWITFLELTSPEVQNRGISGPTKKKILELLFNNT